MATDGEAIDTNYIELTAEIVAAYVAKNSIQASGLPDLIASVHAAVTSLDGRAVITGDTGSRRQSEEVRVSGPRRLPGRWEEIQIPEAPSGCARDDASGVPSEMGIGKGLSDGCSELCGHPLCTG